MRPRRDTYSSGIATDERTLTILLADDNPSDQRLAQEALKDTGISYALHTVDDGADVLAYLRDPERPKPDLVLLDLRMQGMDGDKVLEELYADRALRGTSVVVQTSSDSDIDLVKAFELGALRFVTKPVSAEKLAPVLEGALHGHIEWS